ncbi:MAG TPA: peptidoglycan editing factor PgeF [Thermodesulfovibrionales bacterium]|nr:peptidoglycan editing factor PgeF [Thermodesulfovibrionales bacterium]
MDLLIVPEIFDNKAIAFFTGRTLGADPERLADIARFEKQRIYLPIQKHTDKVLVLDSDMGPKIADAVITNRKDVLIGVQTADCVPILLCDTRTHAIGAVHAGWRGTSTQILTKTIRAMEERFSSSAADILVAIGPSIRGCCYNVGYEVIESVTHSTGEGDYFEKKGEKYFLDLSSANRYQAISSGILSDNIWLSGDCTFCLPEKYYSYRYTRGPVGRQGGFIGLL